MQRFRVTALGRRTTFRVEPPCPSLRRHGGKPYLPPLAPLLPPSPLAFIGGRSRRSRAADDGGGASSGASLWSSKPAAGAAAAEHGSVVGSWRRRVAAARGGGSTWWTRRRRGATAAGAARGGWGQSGPGRARADLGGRGCAGGARRRGHLSSWSRVNVVVGAMALSWWRFHVVGAGGQGCGCWVRSRPRRAVAPARCFGAEPLLLVVMPVVCSVPLLHRCSFPPNGDVSSR
jgi:hypothetical protein